MDGWMDGCAKVHMYVLRMYVHTYALMHVCICEFVCIHAYIRMCVHTYVNCKRNA